MRENQNGRHQRSHKVRVDRPWILGVAILLVIGYGAINLLADRGRQVPPAEQPRTDTLPDTFGVAPAM
jgi:hypothetical protein